MAEQIANSLSGHGYEHIVEVGPGQGMLSKYLIQRSENVCFIEADRDMVEVFKSSYPEVADYVYQADFLKFDLYEHIGHQPMAIIGNFPYNISSQIVFKCIDHVDMVPEMVGMFQLEMAQRIASEPGSKAYGVISVLAQYYYDCQLLFKVGPDQFNPPPKVWSAVIKLTRKQNPHQDVDMKLFKRIVKSTFSQRRKMIRNTLKGILPMGTDLSDDIYNQRPEQLSVEAFIALTNYCASILNGEKNET
ncbi:UNVERIFIED_CONTAM: hypothetical protein GTU68_012627 [Idotea baltica]|nr:hypothetical protein [Idotea baltica]